MDGIITREELARDYANYAVGIALKVGTGKPSEYYYNRAFRHMMEMEDDKFLAMFEFRQGQKLIVIAKNRYLLSNR